MDATKRMFSSRTKFVVVCVVLGSFMYSANALKCYECTKYEGGQCFKGLNKTSTRAVDCRNSTFIIGNYPGMEYQCVTYFTEDRYNITNVVRSCNVRTTENYCKVKRADLAHYGQRMGYCDFCYKDYCNSSFSVKQENGLIGIMILICMSFFFKCA